MKRAVLSTTVLALLLGCTADIRADFIDYVTSQIGQFGTIDLQTGQFTSVGTTDYSPQDLTRLPGGTLFGVDSSTNLRIVNPATGSSTVVGTMGDSIFATKLRSDGTMFGIGSSNLYTINTSTAAPTLVGPTGLSIGGLYDMAFDGNNLFLTNNENLYSVNTSTGSASLIGSIGFEVASMDSENGTLYGFTSDGTSIISINTTTGAGTVVSAQDTTLNVVFGAAPAAGASVSTPEPSSLTLLALGSLGLIGHRWRRRRQSA